MLGNGLDAHKIMKRLFFIILLLTSITCHAQHAIGFRSGGSVNLLHAAESRRVGGTLDHEVFYQSRQSGRLRLQTGVAYGRAITARRTTPPLGDPPSSTTNPADRTEYFTMNTALQLDVTGKQLRHSPIFKNLKSYISLLVSPTLQIDRPAPDNDVSHIATAQPVPSSCMIWYAGLGQSFSCDVSRRIFIISLAHYRFDPARLFEKNRSSLNNQIGLQVGVGYKL